MDQQLRDRRALEHDLKSAVANGELYLEYQPQRHARGEIIGFEALARWKHPQRGIVPPGRVHPDRRGNRSDRRDRGMGLAGGMPRSCVLEARRCRSPSTSRRFNSAAATCSNWSGDVLRETGISPARLELEITEGVLIENVGRATLMLKGLKKLGVSIALDDFGTGYSSLSYLQSFPLDRIKIDRSFVASLGRTGRSLAIVRAVIGLAHGLGLPALAEGVETEDQLAMLMDEGCDEVQGFLIGRPRPIEI